MVANIGNYVPSTVEGLQDKLADAQAAMNATTQAEIDAATETLREARLNARAKADVSALEEIIAYANSLNLAGYTAESRNMLDRTIVAVKRVLADPEATQRYDEYRGSSTNGSVCRHAGCISGSDPAGEQTPSSGKIKS